MHVSMYVLIGLRGLKFIVTSSIFKLRNKKSTTIKIIQFKNMKNKSIIKGQAQQIDKRATLFPHSFHIR